MQSKILSEDTGREIRISIEKRHDTKPEWWLLIEADGGPKDHFTKKELQEVGSRIICMTKPFGSTVTIS